MFEWLGQFHPETVQSIIDQEAMVFQRTGISNAMAQPYFHLIMPLSSARDKATMVHWGIRDYSAHFNRRPQGMWLPETAVDLATLETLALHGITFTILAPWQANISAFDTTKPWHVKLPGGKEIVVFFYNAFLSGEISFNPGASEKAEDFISNWLIPQSETLGRSKNQLIMAASDGELYGHHQPHREKFLSYLLDGAVEKQGIQKQFPALWLRDHLVEDHIEIIEDTSWSCHHGIERWRNVCGDAPSAIWKKPLREFLNELSDSIDIIYENRLENLINDPWDLRDNYIEVLVGSRNIDLLIKEHASNSLTPGQSIHG